MSIKCQKRIKKSIGSHFAILTRNNNNLSIKMNINKNILYGKWKRIKRNGNDRNKRKLLIESILKNSLKQVNFCSSSVQTNSAQNANVSETNYVENVFDSETGINSQRSENINEHAVWENELNDNSFPEINLEINNELLRDSLITELKDWSIDNAVKHHALNSLLKIFHKHFPEINLPKDARTVMKTPKTVYNISTDENGDYWHYGLEKALKIVLSSIDYDTSISLDVNTDGIPLFRYAKKEFWPIQIKIHEFPKIPPLIIGIYYGNGKYISTNESSHNIAIKRLLIHRKTKKCKHIFKAIY